MVKKKELEAKDASNTEIEKLFLGDELWLIIAEVGSVEDYLTHLDEKTKNVELHERVLLHDAYMRLRKIVSSLESLNEAGIEYIECVRKEADNE